MKRANVDVLRLMEQIGGGFDRSLAIAWQRADAENQARLMNAFRDLYSRYEQLRQVQIAGEGK